MNVKGIGMQSIVNIYNRNSVKKTDNEQKVSNKDTIEISTLGKTLSTYDSANVDNKQKVQELKEKISNGTYNINAKLTAQSILDSIKEDRLINGK